MSTLTDAELTATVDAILAQQRDDGLVLWFESGHADPWNHVECAMALAVGDRRSAAERAYEWLAANQLPNGAWHAYYTATDVEDRKLDTNVTAYVATGVWHHWMLHGDLRFVTRMWPVVCAAIDFVLDLQTRRGEILWAVHPSGTPWSYALLTGSSSIFHSLRCAIALAELVGDERPDWELSAVQLGEVIATRPDAFAPKNRWAMDWYYPVLAGAVSGDDAVTRLRGAEGAFVMPDRGVRCVSDRPWVTAAETCEAALAHLRAGLIDDARLLFDWAQHLRADDGAYYTGMVHPEQVHFPGGERTSYSAAAVVLAADALGAITPASGLFLGDGLPALLPID
jgi:hypothetical protein